MNAPGAILFTAFEPSGDALAAPLIAELLRRDTGRAIFALGGPKMQAAGAHIIEITTQDAVMGVPPMRKVLEHRARLARLRAWMQSHSLSAVIPTDSPAANWSVCDAARKLHPSAKIIHLAAPQLWAWAPWRIHKMRRLSDHVLCLLPFEPDWFGQRGVAGTFVGHPLFDRAHGFAQSGLPDHPGAKLAILPGSRASEIAANLPTMLDAVRRLRLGGAVMAEPIIAASDSARAKQIRELAPEDVAIHVGRTDDILAWADVVLAVSGTVTLQVAVHRKPMVVVYHASRLVWHGLGRWIISTRTFTLPNLIGQWLNMPHQVPEFIPHFGAVEPIVAAFEPLMVESDARKRQRELFEAIHGAFEGVHFATAAADAVEHLTR